MAWGTIYGLCTAPPLPTGRHEKPAQACQNETGAHSGAFESGMSSRFVAQVLRQYCPLRATRPVSARRRDQVVGRHFNQRSTQHLSIVLALQDDGDAVLFG